MKHPCFCLILSLLMAISLPADVVCQTNGEGFPFPEIPSMLRTPEARKAFLLNHYWTEFDFDNELLLANKDIAEQGWVNFIALLTDGSCTEVAVKEAMEAFCKRMSASSKGRKTFIPMAKSYLFDPDSPMYNEPFYLTFLRTMLATPSLDVAERARMEFLARLVARNMPGSQAEDFSFRTSQGKKSTLRQTASKVSGKLLLFFYDPECEQCQKTLARMKSAPWLAEALTRCTLTLLAVYTEGNETVWRNTLSEIPSSWLVATDNGIIKSKALYDLKAMPSLYLLDNTARVLIKDGTLEEVRDAL